MDLNRPKGIIDGFEEDFKNIAEEFSKISPDLKLISFFKFWNDKSIDCIFVNRFDPRELLEAIAKINQLLVKIITDQLTYDEIHRTLALYFILCLYVKQPNRLRRKIRLTCEDIICIQKLSMLKLNDGTEADTRFVWRQLWTLEAIEFVEERVIYGPSMLVNKRAKSRAELDPELTMQSGSTTSTEFIDSKLEPALNEIENLCDPYEQIRQALDLDQYKDTTVELQSDGTVREFIDRAKLLLFLFKSDYS